MNDDEYKFVDFEKHCMTCKHQDLKGTEEPCNECVSEPVNYQSEKPVKWEER